MTRCAGGRGRGSLTESYLNPIKHEGTMAEATQETELDAELKQLRDFTSEHSVDVVHACSYMDRSMFGKSFFSKHWKIKYAL